ncbi:uncharacterized protein LOC131231254 isoform X2 [Magnolia sinica]|uniref:uncharacterized protein LOC131231254 isoform X2 n=1 Tax=Magnolia sinica TaxID=86752 RepID=UPI00265B0192|nr:uncharacterized protein LOC131231254 isoform X2 [Magnolia sinica]
MTKKSEVCSDFFIHKFERKVGSVIDGSLRCWKRKRRMFLTLSSLATRTDREERGSGIRHFLLDKRRAPPEQEQYLHGGQLVEKFIKHNPLEFLQY